MTEYEKNIAYNEGKTEYGFISPMDNPYEGVSSILAYMWNEGWWDAFYEEI